MKEPLRTVTAAYSVQKHFLLLSNLSRDCKQMPPRPSWGSAFYQPPRGGRSPPGSGKHTFGPIQAAELDVRSSTFMRPIWGPKDALKRARRRYRKLEITLLLKVIWASLWSRTTVITAGLLLLISGPLWVMQMKWWPFRCSFNNNRDDDQDATTLLLAEEAEGRKYSDLSSFYLTYLLTIAMQ